MEGLRYINWDELIEDVQDRRRYVHELDTRLKEIRDECDAEITRLEGLLSSSEA